MTTLLGLDLGTSSFKVSAYEVGGAHLGMLRRATPWTSTPDGLELDPGLFAVAVREMVAESADSFAAGPVAGVGVTGMAETMFVETRDGRLLPARAWNHRGHRAAVEPEAADLARTGLLEAARAPVVELRRLTDSGVAVRSWSGLPEHAVQVLGGTRVCERSLAARTGLVDVVAGAWDPDLLSWAGVADVVVPGLQPAGCLSGRVHDGSCSGAALTVAGHDHVTAVIGAGANDGATVFDSLGTGEAVLAQVARSGVELDAAAVRRCNAAGFNVGLGVDEDDRIAFAGLGTGNRFNLLLDALDALGFDRVGVVDPRFAPTQAEQEAALRRLPDLVQGLLGRLFGPSWQDLRTSHVLDEVMRATVLDLGDARSIWWSSVVRASENARTAVDSLAELAPHTTRLVAAGGWLRNAGIQAVRARVLGPFTVPGVEQCGSRGAALLAGLAAGVYPSRLDFPPLAATKE